MQAALVLLLACLAVVLYRDRDFWFPDAAHDVAQQTLQGSPDTATSAGKIETNHDVSASKTIRARKKLAGHQEEPVALAAPSSNPVPPTTVTRTVLPPLEVEVVAGSAHRKLRPGSDSLRIDLEPEDDSPNKQAAAAQKETSAAVTTNAADRATIPIETSNVVNQTVRPDYPLLARQMKVQGSVILQALIGRDGLIQNIRVISGPPILASAAQEAVKQWHFKPHYEGAETVETQAKITVNFVISTN